MPGKKFLIVDDDQDLVKLLVRKVKELLGEDPKPAS